MCIPVYISFLHLYLLNTNYLINTRITSLYNDVIVGMYVIHIGYRTSKEQVCMCMCINAAADNITCDTSNHVTAVSLLYYSPYTHVFRCVFHHRCINTPRGHYLGVNMCPSDTCGRLLCNIL